MSDRDLQQRRVTYERSELDVATVTADPFAQFQTWLGEALAENGIVEPNAMSLATVSPSGRPSVRIVLLRGCDERGFVFFTNYGSRKAREIDAGGEASLLFYWATLERQVRIEGPVSRIADAESDTYFATRPRGHRLSAWASPQSAVVPSRAFLDERMAEADERFHDADVPRPPNWGGYRVTPRAFEFWQGRPSRVHDRIAYVREIDTWRIERLAP